MTESEIHRRHLLAGFILSLAPLRLNAASIADRRAAMVDTARQYLKTTDWAPRKEFGPLDKAYYCNIFIADICRKAGTATWSPIPGKLGNLSPRDPLAREWEDPKIILSGWEVVHHASMKNMPKTPADILKLRKPGDVISGMGHVGILSDDSTSKGPNVFSASSTTGAVELNDWSFRLPDPRAFKDATKYNEAALNAASRYTVRRFIGT